jgi:hypothetical protein
MRLFEVKIKNKPNIFFPKSFSDELGGVEGRGKKKDEKGKGKMQSLKNGNRQGKRIGMERVKKGRKWGNKVMAKI